MKAGEGEGKGVKGAGNLKVKHLSNENDEATVKANGLEIHPGVRNIAHFKILKIVLIASE